MDIPGYQIQKKIGQGGMAIVYLAIQESLHRPVVLKILDTDRIESDQWTERFLTEGRLVASLQHPNIITIYDIGLAGDQLYISMEFIEGGDLKQRMELPMLPDDCLSILSQIAEGLDAAHQHGIVHRDVKPANILFRDDDTPLLTDFGIAKEMDGDMDLTSTGIFLGSPNYVSPEQADGLAVDGRSDIYSLGCIFYEMLTGEKPFSSESVVEIVIKHKQSPIPQFPEEYSQFQPLLDRMMAKKREDRFRDCRIMVEFINELRENYQQNSITAEYDLTVAEKLEDPTIAEALPKKNLNSILTTVLIIALVFNLVLHFIEKNLNKDLSPDNAVTIDTTLNLNNTNLGNVTETEETDTAVPQSTSPAVRKALLWLGKQSLEEFRLNYPPKDNAYYYFSKLIEINPDDKEAKTGLLSISERYAVLAEQSIANNDFEKARSYINIGLQINPNSKSLASIQSLLKDLNDPSFFETLRAMFSF